MHRLDSRLQECLLSETVVGVRIGSLLFVPFLRRSKDDLLAPRLRSEVDTAERIADDGELSQQFGWNWSMSHCDPRRYQLPVELDTNHRVDLVAPRSCRVDDEAGVNSASVIESDSHDSAARGPDVGYFCPESNLNAFSRRGFRNVFESRDGFEVPSIFFEEEV